MPPQITPKYLKEFDIGLVRLNSAFKLTEYIQVISTFVLPNWFLEDTVLWLLFSQSPFMLDHLQLRV